MEGLERPRNSNTALGRFRLLTHAFRFYFS